ncbi:MAG: hypothetical protein ABIS67_06325 [Candidatus Eisenbacteria bacterium]
MPLFRSFLLAALVTAALPAAIAQATQVIPLDTRGLVRSSNDIVIGEVIATRSYWNPEGTRILTDVSVRVSETLRGAEGTITLTQLGGEVDGAIYDVPGSPAFRRGEQALLFLWRDTRGRAQVNGMAQGKFDITRDAASGARTVQRPLPGLGFRDPRSLSALRAGERAPAVPLADMVTEVKRLITEGGR